MLRLNIVILVSALICSGLFDESFTTKFYPAALHDVRTISVDELGFLTVHSFKEIRVAVYLKINV